MEKSVIKGVVFDLDDTLYDERSFVEGGFKLVSLDLQKIVGIDSEFLFNELTDILDRDGRGFIFDTILKKYNVYSKETVGKLVTLYRSHAPSIHVYDGVQDMLSHLHERYQLGLITDGLAFVQKNKMAALGIGSYFDEIIYTDELGDGKAKPNPYAFQKIVIDFGINPKEGVYVGDNPYKDFIGAKRMGMKTVRVKIGMYKDIVVGDEHEADFFITDIIKFSSLLERL